ncbi:VPS4-associated protein 1 [Russula compacta]|nr:VPS4-associated protein 1 [Russula compacta]
MSFQNVYYKRATATSRACYVCSKPTTICLSTANAVDFIYTCDAHLSDTGFATELVDPAAAAPKEEAVSKEEIARIKAEWEAKEARKKDKDKAKETNKSGGKDTGGEGEKEGVKKNGTKSPSPRTPSSPPSHSPVASSGAATPTHKRYSLHRDFYAMRQAEHRRRRQTKQIQELAPRFPGAPRGPLAG